MPNFTILAPNGKKYKVSGPNREGAIEALNNQLNPKKDSSLGTALEFGKLNTYANTNDYVADVSEQFNSSGFANTLYDARNKIRGFFGAEPIDDATRDATTVAEQRKKVAELQKQRDALNYESLTSDSIKGPGSALYYGAQKVAESADGIAAALATGGTITPFLGAGEVNASLKEIESLDPEKRVKLATGGGLVIAALENLGLGMLFKGMTPEVVGAMGVKKINSILTAKGLAQLPVKVVSAMATEGVTEGLQEGVVIGADALGGKEFKDNEIFERLKEASIAGAGAGGTIRTGTAAVEGLGPQPFVDTEQSRAATAFARRIKKIAEDNNHNLNDVGVKSTNGAREVVTKAHTQMAEELRVLFSDLKPLVAVNDQDTLADLEDKILAEAGRKEGKNLAKSQVGAQELNALDRLAGEFYEGQKARNLLLEMNELTELHKSGYKGGVSKITDMANPLNNLTHPFSSQGGLTGLATTGAAYMAGGGTGLAIQGGAFAGGRAIDAVTGRRSTVNKYIRDNTKSDRMTQLSPIAPSLREQTIAEAQQAESAIEQQKMEEVALNRHLAKIGAPPKGDPNDPNPSPQYALENATGLNTAEVEVVLKQIEEVGGLPTLQRAIDSYRKSVSDGGKVTNLNELIRFIKRLKTPNAKLNAEPQLSPQGPESQSSTVNAKLDAEPQFGPRFTTQENYNRGIEANKKFNADQKTALNEVNNEGIMSESDYKTLSQAIDELDGNLGSKPLETFEAVYKKLENVDPKLVQEIIDPMYERITKQQRQRTVKTREGKTKEARVAPVPFGNAKMQSIFNVNNPVEGGNYIDLDSKQDLTGNTYQGGSIKIVNGKPTLETSDVQVEPGTKQDGGVKIKTNLFKQKAGWKWVDYDGPETIVSTEARGKHHYSLSNSFDVPVTLQTYPKQTSEPRLRPTSQGEVKLGEQIGTILVRGNPHPVYDEVRVVSGNNEAKVKDQKVMQPVQFGSTTDVALDTNLNNSFTMARDKVYNKGRDFKLDLQAKSLEAQEREGIDLSTLEDANIDRLADFVVADAIEAIKDNQNAIGWYDRTVTNALDTVAELHPEIATDPAAKLQFIWATAVTSNGLKVDKNFDLALDVYETLKETGRFPTNAGIGEAASAINGGLAQYHTMLDQFDGDHAALEQFMNSKLTVRDLEKQYGVKISGEGKDTLVRGASILGPKIGNGFFSNLYGNFDELTMDRWLMRSVGRWRGGLVKINQPMVKKKTTEIKSMLSTADLKAFKPLFKKSGVFPTKRMSNDMVHLFSEVIAKESMSPAWRNQINAIPGGAELRKAGNGLAKYLDGQVEAPAGAAERTFIRSVFTKGLNKLQDMPEIRQGRNEALTMSDLQALLWYPEKRLYDTAKQKDGESRGYKDDEAPDYANAAKTAIGNRLGSLGRTGSPGGGPVPTNAGLPGQPTGTPKAGILGQFFGGQRGTQGNEVQAPQAVSVAEIKAQIPKVKVQFEIGKKGTKYENGLKDVKSAKRLAQATGVALLMVNSTPELLNKMPTLGDNSIGGFSPDERLAMALKPGSVDSEGNQVSDLMSLSTVIHEIAHAMAGSSLQSGQFLGEVEVANFLTNRMDRAGIGSLEDIFGNFVSTPDVAKNKIVAEMVSLQDRLTFKDPQKDEVLHLRQAKMLREDFNQKVAELKETGQFDEERQASAKEYAEGLIEHEAYERSISEISVNALQVALMAPQVMKKSAPRTYKLIQDIFNTSKNKSGVRFYAHPLAMVVAVILAMMARGDEPPEEEQQPLPPGALSPAPGILAA